MISRPTRRTTSTALAAPAGPARKATPFHSLCQKNNTRFAVSNGLSAKISVFPRFPTFRGKATGCPKIYIVKARGAVVLPQNAKVDFGVEGNLEVPVSVIVVNIAILYLM